MQNLHNKNYISLLGIKTKTLIGLYKWERRRKRSIIIDIKMALSEKKIFIKDDLNLTLNYQSIIKLILKICKNGNFKLLETLAENIIYNIFKHFKKKLISIEITIHKPKVFLIVKDISVTLKRYEYIV